MDNRAILSQNLGNTPDCATDPQPARIYLQDRSQRRGRIGALCGKRWVWHRGRILNTRVARDGSIGLYDALCSLQTLTPSLRRLRDTYGACTHGIRATQQEPSEPLRVHDRLSQVLFLGACRCMQPVFGRTEYWGCLHRTASGQLWDG